MTAAERGEHLADGGFDPLDVRYPDPAAIARCHAEWQPPRWPRRTDAPWCLSCGMTVGHWSGCVNTPAANTRSVGRLTGHTSAPGEPVSSRVRDRKPQGGPDDCS